MRFIGFILILLLLPIYTMGQGCEIESDSTVCLNDFISIKSKITGGNAIAYIWQLGDNLSSSQKDPFVKYGNVGLKVLRLKVYFDNGDSCSTAKAVFVHDLPKPDFSLDSSNLCFSKNSVCVINKSVPGSTGSALLRQIILWGDGAAQQNANAQFNHKTCHTYSNVSTFNILLEVTDIKGCKSLAQKNVTLKRDVVPYMNFVTNYGCDTVLACFNNNTQTDSTNVLRYYWQIGNTIQNSNNWSTICYPFARSEKGNQRALLWVESLDGCKDSVVLNNFIPFDTAIFDIVKDKYKTCFDGANFVFEDKGNPKDQYGWYFRDSGAQMAFLIGSSNPQTFAPSTISKKYISLTVFKGSCIETGPLDSVVVLGPIAGIRTTNASLCAVGDTTYFCDNTDYYGSYHAKLLWDFGDNDAPNCTTDTKNGINIFTNCRYSVDKNPKHLYGKEGCLATKLTVSDTLTGCISEADKLIDIGKPKFDTLLYANLRPCTGSSPDRAHSFFVSGTCNNYYIKADSANPATPWVRRQAFENYDTLLDSNGFITIGLVVESGEDTINFQCTPNGNTNRCYDTTWYHHHYQVVYEPKPEFTLHRDQLCAPYNLSLIPDFPVQPHLTQAIIHWGDGLIDTLALTPGDSLPHFKHTYIKNGVYSITFSLNNFKGCELSSIGGIFSGHNTSVTFDTNACAGLPIFFHDKVTYHTDSTEYWRIGTRRIDGRESYQWDFGEGDGFTKNEAVPFHVYKKPGIFNARLVTKDSLDCHDTLYFDVKIRGVRAAIQKLKSVYLCAEIVQFFDSSYLIDPFPGDRIVRRIWDFGDGSQVSYLENPFHYYSSFGTFTVRLIVMNLKGCTDTTYTQITVEGPSPRFSFASDSVGCVPLKVELKNESFNVKNWIWYFGDDDNTIFTTDSAKNVSFTYTKPGVYYLKLFGADSVFNAATGNMQFCSSTWPDYDKPFSVIKKVIVLPYPPADFNMADSVCVDEVFVVANASDPKYKTFVWDFGDTVKTTTSAISAHSYAQAGTYTIILRPEYPLDSTGKFCFDTAVKQIVVSDVEAFFVLDSLRSQHSIFCFKNLSRNGFRYEWDFGQPTAGARNQSTLKDPCHNYIPYKGIYTVCLDAYNSLGCVDRYCLEVENVIEQRLQIPNIFTPGNSDGFNDAFDIDIESEQEYDLQIFNRWGQLVYQSTEDGIGDDGINWDGNNLRGEPCPAGVYYVIFSYRFYFEESQLYQGTVTLIRE